MRPLEVEPPSDSFNPEALKQALLQGREALRQRYYGNGNGAAFLRGHSRLLDDILRRAWQTMAMPDSIALLAVGGYGRQQLFPFSDIDLLVLLPAEGRGDADATDGSVEALLEQWVRLLWDIGLEVGHSVRTIAHCTEEAVKDITVQTSLLEACLLYTSDAADD